MGCGLATRLVAGSDDAVRMAARVASHFETIVRRWKRGGSEGEGDPDGVLGGIGAQAGGWSVGPGSWKKISCAVETTAGTIRASQSASPVRKN